MLDLHVIKLCDVIIGGQSSFSWWAAYFAHPVSNIIFPGKYRVSNCGTCVLWKHTPIVFVVVLMVLFIIDLFSRCWCLYMCM